MEIYNTILSSINTELAGGTGSLITPAKHNKVAKQIVSYIDNKILNTGNQSFVTSTTGFNIVPISFTPNLPSIFSNATEERVFIMGSLFTNGSVGPDHCKSWFLYNQITTSGFNLIVRTLPGTPAVSFIFEYVVTSIDEFPYTLPV